MTRKVFILFSILTLPALLTPSWAQSGRSYSYGHIRYAEGEVTMQRAMEMEASEAGMNVPVMPGDRLWTTYGRAEILFAGGSVLQLDERTKVDFVAFGESAGAETLLRQWNGSLILRIVDASAASYRIDTPSGSVFPISEGLFRIDVDETGVATLSVYEGVAELASETGSALVRTGQRSFVQQGLRPESAFPFNTALYDTFATWSDGREQLHRRTRRIQGVPDEVAVYTGELERYGSWRHDPSYGHVWYPTVSIGWSPYTHGRWSYTSFGWTWISHEPWGWAPYHYGRWGHGSLGWYWIPGAYWGPAWVSWALGPTWVGWSPLGYHNRPIFPYRSVVHYRGGHAVPRHESGHSGRGWSFVKKDHFKSVPVERTRLRVEDVRETADQGRLFESGAILDRDLRPRTLGTATSSRSIQIPDRISGGRPSPPASATRGRVLTIQRGSQGTSVTQRGPGTFSRSSQDSRAPAEGHAVPRVAPAPSRVRDFVRSRDSAPSGDFDGPAPSARGTGRAPTGVSRGSTGSPFGRVGVGGQRGDIPSSSTGLNGPTGPTRVVPGAIRRDPSSVPSPSAVPGPSRSTTSRPSSSASPRSPGMTRGPAVERSKESNAGSKDFFGRQPANVGSSRSEPSRTRAIPRANSPSRTRPSPARSSSGASNRSSNESGNKSGTNSGNGASDRNRNSSRPRN